MVEWCLPHDMNLDGVEFKSMASGSHRITNDFMYVPPRRQSGSMTSRSLQPLSEICPSVFTPVFCFAPRLDISGKAVTSGWPVLLTCLWRASWSEERGWSLWEFCLPPTLCSTATCTSWRTKSGKTHCVSCVCESFSFSLLFISYVVPFTPPYLYSVYLIYFSPNRVGRFLSVCPPPVLASLLKFFSSIKHEPRASVTAIITGAHLHAVFVWSLKHGSGRSLDGLSSLQQLCSSASILSRKTHLSTDYV